MKQALFVLAAVCSLCVQARTFRMPPPLQEGDTIGIVTPGFASGASRHSVEEAVMNRGFVPLVADHAFTRHDGRYTASDSARASDINNMFRRPGVKAILALRGGYGTTRLLPMLDSHAFEADPKWIVGYSDISALHAWSLRQGVASIHGPVASEWDSSGHTDDVDALIETLLTTEQQPIEATPDRRNKTGQASGHLLGGNFIVLNNLAQTSWDILEQAADGAILFLEERQEAPYAIERMLLRLHQAGILERLNGLALGHFTESGKEPGFASVDDLLYARLRQWGYYEPECTGPGVIAFGFPVGHVAPNRPLVEGASVTLTVTDGSVMMEANR